MKFNITLTWSKMVAVVIMVLAFVLDRKIGGAQTFMFALPFVVAMIGGKQAVDYLKEKK